jgi:hypothetical protein
MLHILYVEVSSFGPLDAGASRCDCAIEQVHKKVQQACAEARARDRGILQACNEACMWMALQSYFGAYYLPPLAVARAYGAGNKRPYDDWDLWVALDVGVEQATSLCVDKEFGRLFISVDHDDHLDLLILRENGLDVSLHPGVGSHTDARERLFQPLLSEFAWLGLLSANLPLQVTFVDDQGLHTAQLPAALRADRVAVNRPNKGTRPSTCFSYRIYAARMRRHSQGIDLTEDHGVRPGSLGRSAGASLEKGTGRSI